MDSVPLVAITANVAKSGLGKDSFQEIDIVGATMPITKHNFIVKEIENLAPTLRKAFKIAKSGRPGPVLVDITKDVTANKIEFTSKEPEEIKRYSDSITAVSYTHLDVYKRQGKRNAWYAFMCIA